MLMLLFYVGDQAYAIDTQYIFEVVPYVHLEKTPRSSPYIKGLANFEGNAVTVIDFSELISGEPSAFFLHTRIIFLIEENQNRSQCSLGIIAEKVIEVMEHPAKDFFEPKLNVGEFPFLVGIANDLGKSIQLVDVAKLFHYIQAHTHDIKS